MFELLVPATHEQMDRLNGDQHLYDTELRPSLMMGSITELRRSLSNPTCGKSRGLDHYEDCAKIGDTARRDGRQDVGCIILERTESQTMAAQRRMSAGLGRFCDRSNLLLGPPGRVARRKDFARTSRETDRATLSGMGERFRKCRCSSSVTAQGIVSTSALLEGLNWCGE